MRKAWENYKKPVPIKWRKVGDFVLVISMFMSGSIMGLPIPENTKLWSIFGLNFISTCLKFWANTKKDESAITVDNSDISS